MCTGGEKVVRAAVQRREATSPIKGRGLVKKRVGEHQQRKKPPATAKRSGISLQ